MNESINIKQPEPRLEKKHMVDVAISEACLNGDEECPCSKKPVKQEQNPV